jgi:hypothetical protein
MMDMDVDVLLDQGPDTVTMREELIQAIADRPDVPLEIILELSTLPDKDIILKRLSESKEPPPEVKQLMERMAKLEAVKAAADIDETIAGTEKDRADALTKLAKMTLETGVPPQALSGMFPVKYREPSFVDRLMLASRTEQELQEQEPPQNAMTQQSGPEGRPQGSGSPMGAQGGPALPGEEPELDQAGGLPMGDDMGQ